MVPELSLWRMGASVRAPGRPTNIKEKSHPFKKCPGGGPQGGLLTGVLFILQTKKAGAPCVLPEERLFSRLEDDKKCSNQLEGEDENSSQLEAEEENSCRMEDEIEGSHGLEGNDECSQGMYSETESPAGWQPRRTPHASQKLRKEQGQ